MPRRPRLAAATGYYHVVNRSAGRAPLFKAAPDYLAFLQILGEGVTRFEMPLISYCVLNNHWHLLVGPVGKERLSRVMQWVAATHAQIWHRATDTVGQGAVYQGRFVSTPLHDLASLVPMSRYVERNAKSAGLVTSAEEWPWSSLYQRLSGPERVPVTPTAFLSSALWLDYVNAALTQREQAREALRRRPAIVTSRKRSVPKRVKSVEKGSDPDDPDQR